MSNFVVTEGLGGPLMITDGFGAETEDVVIVPEDNIILNHAEKALALFITQFRQTRVIDV